MTPAAPTNAETDTETAPLLPHTKHGLRSLPVLQLVVLCSARAAESWISLSLAGYLAALIERLGVPNDKIGQYSGAVESIYACFQTAAIIFWPRVSSIYGHRTVLCFCLLGLSLSSLCFGLSTKIWQLLLWRGVSGLFGASTLTVRIIAGEITDKDTAARAYAVLNVIANVVFTISPVVAASLFTLGSSAARPALLPACLNGALGILAFLLGFVCLQGTACRGESVAGKKRGDIGFIELLRTPGAALAVSLCVSSWILATAFGSVMPLFFYTEVVAGGLGMNTQQVSYALSVLGAVSAIWAVLLFPAFTRRFGTHALLRISGLTHIVNGSFAILSNTLLRRGQLSVFRGLLPGYLIFQTCCFMTNTVSMQLVINAASPEGGLGTMNSLATALGAVQRTFVPVSSTSLFAYSVSQQVLNGHLL